MMTLSIWNEFKKKDSDKSIKELQDDISKITEKQTYVTHWKLSKETETKVIEELQSQKADLIKLMHEKIDQL